MPDTPGNAMSCSTNALTLAASIGLLAVPSLQRKNPASNRIANEHGILCTCSKNENGRRAGGDEPHVLLDVNYRWASSLSYNSRARTW